VGFTTSRGDLNFFILVDLIIIYIKNFYFKLSETFKYHFQNISINKLHGAREPYVHTPASVHGFFCTLQLYIFVGSTIHDYVNI
jgi:hypothetical protein